MNYGVPLLAERTTDPSALQKHEILVWIETEAISGAEGCVIVTLTLSIQSYASLSVITYPPAARLLNVGELW